MGAFSDSIKKQVEQIKADIDQQVQAIVQYYFRQIVYHSPTTFIGAVWAKRQFINSCYPAINGFDTSTTSTLSMDGVGSLSRISNLIASKAFYGKDATISLSNNLSYARQVEYQGWVRTGPYAPVDKAYYDVRTEYGK